MRSVLVQPLALVLLAGALPDFGGDSAPRHGAAAAGDRVWRNGTFTLYLTEQPCPSEEFAKDLEDAGIAPARATILVQRGRPTSRGCWASDIEGDVLTRDVGGQEGLVPASWFRPSPDA